MNRLTPVVKNILLLNVIIFGIDLVLKGFVNDYLSLKFVLSDDFIIIQFISYMWLHGDIWHILFNMIALFFFGPMLEQEWGGKKFLQFYIITGIGAGVLYAAVSLGMVYPDIKASDNYISNPSAEALNKYIYEDLSTQALSRLNKEFLYELNNAYFENPDNPVVKNKSIDLASTVHDMAVQGFSGPGGGMVGASGAIYGILFAMGFLFPNMTIMLLIPPIPMKMKYLVLFLGAYAIYSQINRSEGDNVAHLAHLGGMLIAFILLKIWKKKSNSY